MKNGAFSSLRNNKTLRTTLHAQRLTNPLSPGHGDRHGDGTIHGPALQCVHPHYYCLRRGLFIIAGFSMATDVVLVVFCRAGFLVAFFIETTLLWRLEGAGVLRSSLSLADAARFAIIYLPPWMN